MTDKKKVAVVGATGYTGQELVRLLLHHPGVEIIALTSRQNAGDSYAALFPRFRGADLPALSLYHPEELKGEADLIFFCLPHGESQEMVGKTVDLGLPVVDLSADFRLNKITEYRRYYGDHRRQDLLKSAVYGLPELHREKIKKSRFTANPGCYPIGVILGAYPLIKSGAADPETVIADMKSGTSGAGRKAALTTSFCEVNEALRPYNLYGHRHRPEMEQELARAAKSGIRVVFTPHLVPMNRGILGTIYLRLANHATTPGLHEILARAYKDEPFVRVLPPGDLPCVSNVRGTNFVDLAVTAAPSGKDAIVITAMDNLVKGAAGCALQNMNLMLGLPETEGLSAYALRP